jgi:RNA 3'-terminal phosphate cyclase-like protein
MFRHKIIFSLLSGKALKINEMRPEDPIKPGIRDYEVNFLRFIDSITTGTALKINNTGTSIKFSPGMLLGGKVTHSCTTQRSIGYLIEACLILGPFCKEPLDITFTDCITNSDTDLSCDIIRAVSIRQLQHFGIGAYDLLGVKSEVPEIKVTKRGAPPLGGGEVKFTCPIVKTIQPCTLIDPGMIKRVRGLAYTTKCSSSFAQRMVSASRGVLHGYIGDIHIYTDTFTRKEGGDSPGYAIGLAAESTTGCVLSSQRTAITPAILAQMNPNTTADTTSIEDSLPGDVDLLTPEDVGRVSAKALLEEISYGGCVDGYHQLLFLCYMALGPEQQVSRVRFGTITPQAVYMLRLLKEFWNIEFQLQPDVKSNTVLVSCVGLGYQNMNKKMC